MNTNMVKIGTEVKYRGCWGTAPETQAKVKGIELCKNEHEKYGTEVQEVPSYLLYRCVLVLSDGHWAYGYQVTEIIG